MSRTVVELNYIQCIQTSEPGHDEVFMICQSDGNIPIFLPPGIWKLKTHGHSMANGDVWAPVNRQGEPVLLSFEHNLVITLWDGDVDDDPTVSSYLVNFSLSPDSFNNSNYYKSDWVTPGNDGYNAHYAIELTKTTTSD